MPISQKEFWQELDAVDEDEIRIRVATGKYGKESEKRALAEQWLHKKAQERLAEARKEASQAEQISIARSAKDAAWEAAEAARVAAEAARVAASEAREQSSLAREANATAVNANRIAIAAIIIGAIAALMSLVSFFR